MRITTDILRKAKACAGQIDLFKATFPEGADITRENLILARTAGLKLIWFPNLLPKAQRTTCRAAISAHWDIFEADIVPHWQTYKAGIAPHWQTYNANIAPYLIKYQTAIAPYWAADEVSHRATYQMDIAPHWQTYKAAIAPYRIKYDAEIAPLWIKYQTALIDAILVAAVSG